MSLLDQRIVAGIGNVYKSEVLFLAGVHPDTPASAVPLPVLERMMDIARGVAAATTSIDGSSPRIQTYRSLRHDQPRDRARREPVGLRPRRQAVPKVRDADRDEEDGRRGALDLLVPKLPMLIIGDRPRFLAIC